VKILDEAFLIFFSLFYFLFFAFKIHRLLLVIDLSGDSFRLN
jgi:hypothetical protein